VQRVNEFFAAIDAEWRPATPAKVQLSIIGSGALMLQTKYERGTKDSDVFETTDLTQETVDQLVRIAGKGTRLHGKHLMYIDIVRNGIPFLPQPPLWHSVELQLEHIELRALGVVDVVVSKCKPFRPSDESDIDAMTRLGLVPHEQLLTRFRSAFDVFAGDARAPELREYVKNLNRVERDLLGEDETQFEFPSWI
jgi:hypothetical protein